MRKARLTTVISGITTPTASPPLSGKRKIKKVIKTYNKLMSVWKSNSKIVYYQNIDGLS